MSERRHVIAEAVRFGEEHERHRGSEEEAGPGLAVTWLAVAQGELASVGVR